MDFQTQFHDIAKELVVAIMVWVAGRLGHKVQKVLKDVGCLFDRVRAIETHLKLGGDPCDAPDGCNKDTSGNPAGKT